MREARHAAAQSEAQPGVEGLPDRRGVETDQRDVGDAREALPQERRAETAPAHDRVDQHHGHPGDRRSVERCRVAHRCDRADDLPCRVFSHHRARWRAHEELLPVARQLIPVAQAAQAQPPLDVGGRHLTQRHVGIVPHAGKLDASAAHGLECSTRCPSLTARGKRRARPQALCHLDPRPSSY